MADTQKVVGQLRAWADILEEQDYAVQFTMQTNDQESFQKVREAVSDKDLEYEESMHRRFYFQELTTDEGLGVRITYLNDMRHED